MTVCLPNTTKHDTNLVENHGASPIPLLSNGKLDTLELGQGDPWLVPTDDTDIAFPGGKHVLNSILDVDNVETTIVALTVRDDTNTTHVASTSHHHNGTCVKLDHVANLASGQVDLDSVINLYDGIRITDAVFSRPQMLVSKLEQTGDTYSRWGRGGQSKSPSFRSHKAASHENERFVEIGLEKILAPGRRPVTVPFPTRFPPNDPGISCP